MPLPSAWACSSGASPYVLAVKASTGAHPAGAVPEPLDYAGRGRPSASRYRTVPSSLQELAVAAGRKSLRRAI